MFNFVDLNNNIEIKYEQIGNVPTYNIYTKKKLELESNSNMLITDKLVMENYDDNIDLVISTADININLPSDEHLRYLISANDTDGSWELYLINLTSEKITLDKDSHIAEFKTDIDTLLDDQYKELAKKYNDLGKLVYNSKNHITIFDNNKTIKDIQYSMVGTEEQILIKL